MNGDGEIDNIEDLPIIQCLSKAYVVLSWDT